MNPRIREAKRQLPLPELLNRLGLAEYAKISARCPFHDDKHNSFSVWESRDGLWFWKCHAGCGYGDEISLLEQHGGTSRREAIKVYLEMAGVNGSTSVSTKPTSTSQLDWRACVAAFTDEHVKRLAEWRGYSIEFCCWLKENELVGLYDGCIAFPIRDEAGKPVAAHYKPKTGESKWLRHPKGFSTRPIVIGELGPGEPVYIFESQWDAFAFMDTSGERSGIIVTLGSENGKLVSGLIAAGATVYAWKQNDELKNGKRAGDEWMKDIANHAGAKVLWAKIPQQFKDLNDWTRAGATGDDLFAAVNNAEVIHEAPPTFTPEELFSAVKEFVTCYVVFSRPEHADVIALWIMHAWVTDCADFTPYLYLHSPVMRCGKTQVQRVAEPLVKNPLRTCNVSEAALYREIEESHPTLLWDEIDTIFGNRKSAETNENKRALLNAGYERGNRAIRMERGGSGFVKVSYDPFCPKILAGIGRLPETIVDRSISILIHRRLKTQSCEKYRRRDRAKAKPLHYALEKWSSDPELQRQLREARPKMPEGLNDRQEDIWEPLLALADSVGGDVPRLARAAVEAVSENGDELSYGAEQLAATRKLIGDKNRITSAELIEGLWEAEALPARLMEDEEPNYKKIGHWLSKFIQSYGGNPARKLRFGNQTSKGYESAELKSIFDRYCPPESINTL
jgi:hypothetical protein